MELISSFQKMFYFKGGNVSIQIHSSGEGNTFEKKLLFPPTFRALSHELATK